jgi:hypothetical protein
MGKHLARLQLVRAAHVYTYKYGRDRFLGQFKGHRAKSFNASRYAAWACAAGVF